MLTPAQFETLSLVVDTFVPSVARTPDPGGYFARKGTDTGTHFVIAELIRLSSPEGAAQMGALLDFLASPGLGATWGGPEKGFGALGAEDRERVLLAWMHSPAPELRASYTALAGLVFPMYYGFADER